MYQNRRKFIKNSLLFAAAASSATLFAKNWSINMAIFDKYDFLSRFAVSVKDIEYLRNFYLPEHVKLEALVGRKIDCWRYGH